MRNPIIDIKGGTRGIEIPIVENKQILILLRKTLDHMRLTLREVPNIALIQNLKLIAAILVDGADANLTLVDVPPFSNAVPMQLPNAAFGQVLLGTGDVVAGGQVGDDLLSDPAAGQLAGLRVGEAPFEVLY
jgi:hypothetical protein